MNLKWEMLEEADDGWIFKLPLRTPEELLVYQRAAEFFIKHGAMAVEGGLVTEVYLIQPPSGDRPMTARIRFTRRAEHAPGSSEPQPEAPSGGGA